MQRLQDFQIVQREVVEPHVAVCINAFERGDVAYLRVLGIFQILQYGAGGNEAVAEIGNAEALHVLHMEVFRELLQRCLHGEDPVIEFECLPHPIAEELIHLSAMPAFYQRLLWSEAAEHLLYVLGVALIA